MTEIFYVIYFHVGYFIKGHIDTFFCPCQGRPQFSFTATGEHFEPATVRAERKKRALYVGPEPCLSPVCPAAMYGGLRHLTREGPN